jgi:hypothetical protein
MPEITPPAPEPTGDAPAAQAPTPAIKDVTIDGYTFPVNFDAVDDVENVELIDKIENQANVAAIVEFLQRLLGADEYQKLKDYFVQKDGRFKLSKLGDIYQAIFEKFDPKG